MSRSRRDPGRFTATCLAFMALRVAVLLLCLGGSSLGSAAAPGDSTSPAAPETAAAARYDIERYLNIRAAGVVGLSHDGQRVAFGTNVTGSRQIWTVPATGGWPEQITFFPEPVSGAAWSPRGDLIALAVDKGGDENYQLYLVSPDGSELVTLTSSPSVRHNLGSWSKDGRFLSYASNERDRKFFDVYVLDVDARRSRRVVEGDADWGAGPFSRDGGRMVAVRTNASMDNDLFVVDLTRGIRGAPPAAAHLTPHEGRARYQPGDWSADDRSLWIISNSGRDFAGAAALDVASRKLSWVRTPAWDISHGAVSPDGRRLALVVNEDGYDRLHVLDAATLRDVPLPALPVAQIAALHFSRDGRRLVLTAGGPTRTNDVWLLNLEGRTAGQVTRSSTAGIPPSTFVEPRLVRYRSFDGLEIPAFFHVPAGPRPARGFPCVVRVHGGPEAQTTAQFSPPVQFFVNHGYAVLAPNVRGSTGYGRVFTHLDDVEKREDAVKDLAACVDWLTASGVVDPERVAVMGGSYGGYMTLAAITLHPDLWAAAVNLYGIANFRTFFGRTASYRVSHRASEYGDPVKDAALLDSLSPIHRVDRIRVPLIVLHGANDPRVPREEAEQIVAAVRGKGGVAEYVLFPDEGHGFAKLANNVKSHRAIVDFLDRHLRTP